MIPFPNKKYNIIYADPPWIFDSYNDKWQMENNASRWIGQKYPLMDIKDIYDLDVNNIAEKDSVLFIWVTFPRLQEGLETIKKWGFEYKTNAFTWVKRNKKSNSWFWGMGYYTRSNAELCLLATKGNPLPRFSRKIHSVIDTPIEGHSKKPSIIRQKIVELFGDLPRIELFARPPKDRLFEDESFKGWDVWGNEV